MKEFSVSTAFGRNAYEEMEWNEHSLLAIPFLSTKLPNRRRDGIFL